ncbi:MAG: hypothetical protein H7325_03425 [Pedobacter sp.]|nr:hypothetical protein [Pedobacter sp.]
MKKIMFTVVIVMMGIGATFAQTSTNPKSSKKAKYTAEQRAQKATDELNKKVMLTADQKTKVYQLELSKFNKSKELMTQNLDKEAKRSQFREINKASSKEMYGVLTSDQQAKLKAMRNGKKERMAGKHKRSSRNQASPVVSDPPSQGQ